MVCRGGRQRLAGAGQAGAVGARLQLGGGRRNRLARQRQQRLLPAARLRLGGNRLVGCLLLLRATREQRGQPRFRLSAQRCWRVCCGGGSNAGLGLWRRRCLGLVSRPADPGAGGSVVWGLREAGARGFGAGSPPPPPQRSPAALVRILAASHSLVKARLARQSGCGVGSGAPAPARAAEHSALAVRVARGRIVGAAMP